MYTITTSHLNKRRVIFPKSIFLDFYGLLEERFSCTTTNSEEHSVKMKLLREMVKTIVLRQDPPFWKKTGGLFMYPPPPTLKDGVLFVRPPLYQE